MRESAGSAAKKFVSIRGNVSIPGGSSLQGLVVDVVSSRDGALRQLPVASDGSFGENVKLKGAVTLTARDVNGKLPNFARTDGIGVNVGGVRASSSLVLKPQKRSSYTVQLAFPEIPDPVTGVPLPNPNSGSFPASFQPNVQAREDLGVLPFATVRSGAINQAAETDWYRVALTAGESYQFSANAARDGSSVRTLLFDPSGLLMNNPFGLGAFTFSPGQTGTYFLAVGQSMNPSFGYNVAYS